MQDSIDIYIPVEEKEISKIMIAQECVTISCVFDVIKPDCT